MLAWNERQRTLMAERPDLVEATWRPAAMRRGKGRADPDQRWSMIFARAVPAVFIVAWTILTGAALVLPGGR